MKENRKLLREVLNDIRHDMTDEEVLNLLADSKISVKPESGKEKGQNRHDHCIIHQPLCPKHPRCNQNDTKASRCQCGCVL